MGFVSELIRDSLPIWQQCLDSDFVRGVADGSLPEDCFQGYIVDDSLYLREYAKVFAWGMLHARDMAEIRNYYSLLSFVNESEDATRLAYLRRYHLTDEQIQRLSACLCGRKTGPTRISCWTPPGRARARRSA